MTRTYIVADDSMQGRDTGKNGGLKSATYIAGELKRMGLEPAGSRGTFLQQIPWINLRPNPANELLLGDAKFNSGSDFLLVPRVGLQVFLNGPPYGVTFRGVKVPTIYGGRIGDSAIAAAAVAGKVVVFAMPRDRPSFSFWQRHNLRRYSDAAAILVATLDLGAPNQYRAPRDTYWDSTGQAETKSMTVISISNAMADRIFGRRLGSVEVGATGEPLSGEVGYINSQTEAPAYNAVGIIRGTDAKLRNSYVAVGMHHDHIGMSRPVDHDSIRAFNSVVRVRGADDPMPQNITEAQWATILTRLDSLHREHGGPRLDSINNGADDGSGTVLGLEIAEELVTKGKCPKRSVLFVFHTAEEKGLYGAQYYSDHPTVPRVNKDTLSNGPPSDLPNFRTRTRCTAVESNMSTTDRREGLAARLRERVLAHLALGVLRPGEQLPGARELAREYGADPRVVLDAFRTLERDDIVEMRSRSGVYVAPPSDGDDLNRRANWLAGVLHQGLKFGAPAPDLAGLVARSTESLRIRAAIIDCNEDELWSNQQELRRDYGIEASTFLLTEVSASGRLPAAVRDASLIVSTQVHEETVGRIAGLVGATFIPLKTQSELFAEVRRMVADTEVHFVVNDERYAQKVHYLLLQGDPDDNLKLHVLGRTNLADIPTDAAIYVSPLAKSRLADSNELPRLRDVGQTQVREFSDETSLALLRVLTRANLAVDEAARTI